jgi:two-component system cell cycle sensor histidine kinase/response regulator CckA
MRQVLFVSGYTDDTVVRHGILAAEVAFLQKPFTAAVLAAKVRDVVEGQTGAAQAFPYNKGK